MDDSTHPIATYACAPTTVPAVSDAGMPTLIRSFPLESTQIQLFPRIMNPVDVGAIFGGIPEAEGMLLTCSHPPSTDKPCVCKASGPLRPLPFASAHTEKVPLPVQMAFGLTLYTVGRRLTLVGCG